MSEAALAGLMGIKRSRDLRRRVLDPLEGDGVAECIVEGWRLTEDWRVALRRVLDFERGLEIHLYGKSADERDAENYRRQRDAFRHRHRNRPAPAPTEREMRERREGAPDRRRKAVEWAIARLFREYPEYRRRRVGQICCGLTTRGVLPDDFPRGVYPGGAPGDGEVGAILEANGFEAAS